jgi:hypothetical protein
VAYYIWAESCLVCLLSFAPVRLKRINLGSAVALNWPNASVMYMGMDGLTDTTHRNKETLY